MHLIRRIKGNTVALKRNKAVQEGSFGVLFLERVTIW